MRHRREFLSTLSLRRATARRASRQQPAGISIHALLAESDNRNIANGERQKNISIHALLAESDGVRPTGQQSTVYFYPRSPCGERPLFYNNQCQGKRFLSTLSLRRATREGPRCQGLSEFLSTLSLRRATGFWRITPEK